MAAFMRPCVYGFVFIFLFLHRTKHTFSFFLHLEYLDMILILFIVRVRAQRCFHSIFFLLSSYTDHSYYTIEEKEKKWFIFHILSVPYIHVLFKFTSHYLCIWHKVCIFHFCVAEAAQQHQPLEIKIATTTKK